jgi:TPR repeat protein
MSTLGSHGRSATSSIDIFAEKGLGEEPRTWERMMAADETKKNRRWLLATAGLLVCMIGLDAARACSLDQLNSCISSDPAAAERLLLEEVTAGRGPEGLRRLGDFYLTAAPPFQDYALAIKYYEESARAGDSWAMHGLAKMLLQGRGVPADPNCAIPLLERAAELGLGGPSFNALGDYFRSTNEFDRAVGAYTKSSDAGEVWAMKSLADMLFKGEGTSADAERAISLLTEASLAGLEGPAFYSLGSYYRSIGELPKALEAYERASEVGEPWAMVDLADMLLRGVGTAPDPDRAIALLQGAAAGGLLGPSYLAMGQYFRSQREPAKALLAFERASDAGETEATQMLADMLYAGEGTSPDPDRAEALLEKANLPLPDADLVPDPPSTYTGTRLRIGSIVSLAYAAGFKSEEQLLTAVAVAISESGLWTSARNWQPHRGYRRASAKVTVVGPETAWSKDGKRQLHSDRGLWQVASFWWPQYSDADMDDPAKSAAAAYVVSENGTDFSNWDSYGSGYAQALFDQSVDGWPALRPIVVNFLQSLQWVEVPKPNWTECLDRSRATAAALERSLIAKE